MQDLYSILGVPRDAESLAIKAAYRTLAKQAHPDVNLGDDAAEDRTKEINLAYKILGDPELRAAYDRELGRLSGRRRKIFFMYASAGASGIAAFAITVGGLTATIPWLQTGHPEQQIQLASNASGNQIGHTAGEAPVSEGSDSGPAVTQTRQAGGIRAEAAQEIASAGPEASEAQHGDGVQQAPVRIASAAPVASEAQHDSAAHERSGPSVLGAAGTTPAAGSEMAAASLPSPSNEAPARETGAEQAALFQDVQPAAAAVPPDASARQIAAAGPSGQAGAEPEETGVHRERTPAKKIAKRSDERAKPADTADFVPPRLHQAAETLPWPASRKTMALHWQSGGAPIVPTR